MRLVMPSSLQGNPQIRYSERQLVVALWYFFCSLINLRGMVAYYPHQSPPLSCQNFILAQIGLHLPKSTMNQAQASFKFFMCFLLFKSIPKNSLTNSFHSSQTIEFTPNVMVSQQNFRCFVQNLLHQTETASNVLRLKSVSQILLATNYLSIHYSLVTLYFASFRLQCLALAQMLFATILMPVSWSSQNYHITCKGSANSHSKN